MEKSSEGLFQWRHPHLVDHEGASYRWLVLGVITLLLILTMFSIISTSVAESVVQGHFSISDSSLIWVNVSFLLALVVAVPLSEFFAERNGYKLVLFVGTALFTLGVLLSAFAPSLFILYLSRLISGFGSGLFVPISIAVLAKTFEPKQLPFALALYSAFGFGGGLSIAFYFGGYLAEYASWHWVFLPTFIVGVPCLVVIWLVLSESEPKDRGRFDLWGYLAYAVSLSSLLIILNSAKAPWNTEGWFSPFMKAFYHLFVISLIAFIWIELKTKSPLFQVRLFTIRPFVLGNILIFFVGAIYFATAQMFPPTMQSFMHYSKYTSGIYMIPHGAFLGISSALLGLSIARIGIRIPLIAGCTILGLTCYMQFYLSVYSDHFFILALLTLRGLGVGLAMGPVTALALRRVPSQHVVNASMIVTLLRQIGAACASSILGIIRVVRGAFHESRYMEQVGEKTPEYSETISRLKGHFSSRLGESSQEAAIHAKGSVVTLIEEQAKLDGMNDGYIILGTAILLMTLIVTFFMLRAKFLGHKIDVNSK